MIVVSDASPLIALVNIRAVEVLQALFGGVATPVTVRDELKSPKRPEAVRAFIKHPPPWLTIQAAVIREPIPRIDPGKQEAIALALELKSPLILMDDRDGRAAAKNAGLTVTGTVGVLDTAARQGLLDLEQAFVALRETDFYISPRVLELALERFRRDLSHRRAD